MDLLKKFVGPPSLKIERLLPAVALLVNLVFRVPRRLTTDIRDSRIIRDAHATNGERQSGAGGDGIGIRGGRRKRDAVNLGIRRYGDIGRVRKSKVAISAGPLGTPSGVQLAAVFQSPEIGSRSHWALICVGNGWKDEYQRAANRCRISVFKVISGFAIDARDYCPSKLATGKAQ